MYERKHGRVEDYTGAFLGMVYLLLVFGLVTIWGMLGYAAALGISALIHVAIRRFGDWRARTEAEWDARVAAAIARARR